MKIGDHVKFIKPHHAMNWELEKLEGSLGKIIQIEESPHYILRHNPRHARVLVRFDKPSSRSWALPEFWIRMDRLEQ